MNMKILYLFQKTNSHAFLRRAKPKAFQSTWQWNQIEEYIFGIINKIKKKDGIIF